MLYVSLALKRTARTGMAQLAGKLLVEIPERATPSGCSLFTGEADSIAETIDGEIHFALSNLFAESLPSLSTQYFH